MDLRNPAKDTLIVVALVTMMGCQKQQDTAPLYGQPTQLDEQDPLGTICQIQASFQQLPKPVMANRRYVPGWTSTPLGAAPVKHRGYYQIDLTPDALTFLTQHARLELVASLVPLFGDPQMGGEAATLLAGIPAGNPSVQGGTTANLSNALESARYHSPEKAGNWHHQSTANYSKAKSMYGLTNKTQSIHQQRPVAFNHTLEARLVEILNAHSKLPLKVLSSQPQMPQPHTVETIREWVKINQAPELVKKAQDFIALYPASLAAITLFPMLPEPGRHLNRDEILMMYLLNLQDQYWPALLHLSSGQREINELRLSLQKAIQQKIASTCL